MNKQNSTPRDLAKTKFDSARANLLLMIILTAINVVMVFMESDTMLLFSATIPYILVLLGMVTQIDIMIVISICFAAAILLIYLLCWGMSKRHHGWMIAALVLFAIDTAAMAFMYFSSRDFSGFMDVFMHAWILYYLATGIKYGKQLHNISEEDTPIETKDYITYEELETEGELETDNIAIRNSQPISRAEEDVKHRILLEADAFGYHICYRRVKRMNQLIINGWIYAQVEMLIEPPHVLQAVVDGHLIEAGLDEFPHSFIKVDGEIIAKKFRLA